MNSTEVTHHEVANQNTDTSSESSYSSVSNYDNYSALFPPAEKAANADYREKLKFILQNMLETLYSDDTPQTAVQQNVAHQTAANAVSINNNVFAVLNKNAVSTTLNNLGTSAVVNINQKTTATMPSILPTAASCGRCCSI